MTKIAIVVQRYGPEIVGGAESLCRHIAERLTRQLGWQITVYTTEALDYVTWKNELHRPHETINGVEVKRFKVWFPRYQKIFGLYHGKVTPIILRLAQAKRLGRFFGRILERVWIVLQGPFCPSLIQALRREADQYEKVFFFTYLYYPTIFGAKALKGRNFALIPTAHRESPFYFQHVGKLLLSANRVFVNIAPEQGLIESRLGMQLPTIRIAGLGFDIPQAANDKSPFGQKPYILYLGRICDAKGVRFLIEAFQTYLSKNPHTDIHLALVGKKDEDFAIPTSLHIHYLGFVDDTKKFALIKDSVCVVNPSQYESLSMIAIEAMVCLKPLILNRNSEVLNYYCQTIDTCFGYSTQEEFADILAAIVISDWQTEPNQQRLLAAKKWAELHYSWESVTKAYLESPAQFA